MPKRDRTGPASVGPMTGCGLGHCADHSAPGMRVGCGRRRGWWGARPARPHWYYATGLPRWARYGYPGGPPVTEEQVTV